MIIIVYPSINKSSYLIGIPEYILYSGCSMLLSFLNRNSYLIVGVGGGGDIVSAGLLAAILKRTGIRVKAGSIAWERFTIDPVPGPIRLGEIRDVVRRGEGYVVVNGSSYAMRGGRKIVFQAANVARALDNEIAIFTLEGGVKGYVEGVRNYMEDEGLEGIIGIDVGGDVLATGYERELWSPLADAAGLAMLNAIPDSILTVHSPGADGELPQEYVLERISLVYRMGGGLGAYGLTLNDILIIEKILKHAVSEASRIPLLAFKGYYGSYVMRGGYAKTIITPVNTIMFFLDAHSAYKLSFPAKIVADTESFDEIVAKLNAAGIYTEYNLEKDLAEHADREVLEVREMGRMRIQRIGGGDTAEAGESPRKE
jgi:hypothetical protein